MNFINEFLEKNAIIDGYIKENFFEKNENNKRITDFAEKRLFEDNPKLRAAVALGVYQLLDADFIKLLPFASCVELLSASVDIKEYAFGNIGNGRKSAHSPDDALTFRELITAADAMNSLAYEFISFSDLPSSVISECLRTISISMGLDGTLGSCLAKPPDNSAPSEEKYNFIEKKTAMQTASLFMSGAWVGAIISGADIADYGKIGSYAKKLGIAYHVLSYANGQHKSSAMPNLDVSGLREYADNLLRDCREIISSFGDESLFLRELAGYFPEIFEV